MLTIEKTFREIIGDNRQFTEQISIRREKNPYAIINEKEQTSLHIAAQNGNLEELTCLLSGNITPCYQRDKEGNTALHLAAKNGHYECLDVILQKILRDLSLNRITSRESINVQNNMQETALHLAVQNNQCKCVELLIKHMDTNIKNFKGQTALCLAVVLKNSDVVNVFVDNRRVNCDIQDENRDSVYDHVMESENRGLVESLLHHYTVKEKETQKEIEESKTIAFVSQKASQYFNRFTVAVGAVAAAATTYSEFSEDSVDSQVKRALVKLSLAIEHLADGMKQYADGGVGKKKFLKGEKLAKDAATSAHKVKKIIALNKGPLFVKTVGTVLSTGTIILLAPTAILYCVSRHYEKRQKSLLTEEEVCEDRRKTLKSKRLELKKQEEKTLAIEGELLKLEGSVTELRELQSISSREKEPIAGSAKLERCHSGFERTESFRSRTGSYGAQDAKKIAEEQQGPSFKLQCLSVEQPGCSNTLKSKAFS